MAFVSPEYVKQMQIQHNAPFWRLTDRTKKLVINRNESSVLNTSIDQLQDALNACNGDYVCVTLYTIKPEQLETGSKRGQQFDLMVKLNDPYVNAKSPSQTPMNGPSWADMMAMHDKINQLQIERIRLEYEHNEKESTLEKLLNNPKLDLLLSALMAPKKQHQENISGPKDQINETLNKLSSIDPDYQNTLAKMAEYLKQNPSVLPQIKTIIGA
jgi:hypothetical protein